MNARTQRARQIMKQPNHTSQRVGENTFKVKSQTIPDKYYTITKTDNGLTCECPDHQSRKSDCKHIKVVLEYCKKNVFDHDGFRIMERAKLQLCKYCDSGNIVKRGIRKNKSGNKQLFKCTDCNRTFTINFDFEKMRSKDYVITRALDMYYKGMSVRDIADNLEQEEIDVSHMTIYRWIEKYSKMTSKYLNGIIPRVGEWFRADEVWVKIAGNQNYLFASMDDDTRYWLASDIADNKFQHNADNLLGLTKLQAGKPPTHFITDKLLAYMKSSKRIFGKKTHHTANAGIRSRKTGQNFHPSNNKMERLNGEIRDREKVFRGLKKMDTEILNGMRVYYNFTKKHESLKEQTPAESAKIMVDGKNKWKTIIQNASLSKNSV